MVEVASVVINTVHRLLKIQRKVRALVYANELRLLFCGSIDAIKDFTNNSTAC